MSQVSDTDTKKVQLIVSDSVRMLMPTKREDVCKSPSPRTLARHPPNRHATAQQARPASAAASSA